MIAIQKKYRQLLEKLLFVGFVILVQSFLYDAYNVRTLETHFGDGLIGSHLLEFGKRKMLILFIVFSISIGLSIYHRKTIRDIDRLARYLFLAIVVIQTYTIGLMEYNHYFDSWFLWDRVLLFGLGVLAVYFPLTLPFYIFQLVLLTNQLEFPNVIGYDHTHKSLVLPILLSFWVFIAGNTVLKNRFNGNLYVIVLLSIIATWYLMAGIGKYQLNWYADNNLYNLYAASVDAGWLNFMPENILKAVGRIANSSRVVLQYGALATELIFPLLLLTHRKVAAVCLISFAGFHTMVYVLSGIFFWQWIVIELIITWVILRDKTYSKALFTKQHLLVYAFLLLLVPNFINVIKLAWLDCGYINSYTFFLVEESGEQKRLDTSFFSPYDVGFAKNRFSYSLNQNFISNTLGQCMNASVLGITGKWQTRSLPENINLVDTYKAEKGYYKYDESKTAKFIHFLTTFATNKAAYDPKLISRLDVPLHMQQGDNQQNMEIGKLQRIKILYEEKVILPNLEFYVVQSDSTFVELPTE